MGLEKNRDAGIYCQLSNDDERMGESVSIENQKLFVQKYLKEQGWNEVEMYCDDGYYGVNFERPAVKRMIEDAKAGCINIIVVKDLSRFGRNCIEIGSTPIICFPPLGAVLSPSTTAWTPACRSPTTI
ncbi:MAG: recombinase family protein [Christensenellales bacterium]|jgi:site-specific DNA recombinase